MQIRGPFMTSFKWQMTPSNAQFKIQNKTFFYKVQIFRAAL